MITQTFKCNFSVSCLITRHPFTELPMKHSLQASIPILKTCKKWDMILSSSMAMYMYSVKRDIHDARRVYTNGKRMSCSLLIGHMQIIKLIDLKTMSIWKWITFSFFTHCICRGEKDNHELQSVSMKGKNIYCHRYCHWRKIETF